MPSNSKISRPTDRPIGRYIEEILKHFQFNPNQPDALFTDRMILMAPPGSGKTLGVPAALVRLVHPNKKIVVLVPKRIAAASAAHRVAEENRWEIGKQVGYQVRFEQRMTAQTTLIFMTEGVFAKRMHDEEFLNSIEFIVFDEFHERSSLNDIIFGYCYERQILLDQRLGSKHFSTSCLKIIVMSATLAKEKLIAFLEDAKVIEVDDKPFPLKIIHSKKSQRLVFDSQLVDSIVDAVKELLVLQKNDILVFLPGFSEMRQVQSRLNSVALSPSRTSIEIELLHGSTPLQEQRRILQAPPQQVRRIILATNVAESSLTIPSVDSVIDTGLEKKAVYEKKIGFQRLELKRISLFSAKQRAGRAARIGPGIAIQLWHESDELSMPSEIEPEILRSALLEESLILFSLGINSPQSFSWLDQPKESFQLAIEKLKNWQLIDIEKTSPSLQNSGDAMARVSSLGKLVQQLPLSIERSLLFVELMQKGLKSLAAKFIAILESSIETKEALPSTAIGIQHYHLNEQGKKIEEQLLKIHYTAQSNLSDFRDCLILTFLKYFPEKMAQRKSANSGISSLGRGVKFAEYLNAPNSDYFLLFSGRDISDTTTQIDGAIFFSQQDFERLSQQQIRTEWDFILDIPKRKLFKQQRKLAGCFTLSIGTKLPVSELQEEEIFKSVFTKHIDELIQNHPDTVLFEKKIHFLKKKSQALGYNEPDFEFMNHRSKQVVNDLLGQINSISQFMDYDLRSYFLECLITSTRLKADFQKLPDFLELPSGHSATIDYEAELAPLISVRLQRLLGMKQSPKIVDNKITVTIEILAPNNRPTQITGDLENFWKKSYHDVRKDLRARYPKHAWPEDPIQFPDCSQNTIKKNTVSK